MEPEKNVVIVKNSYPNVDENDYFYLHDYPPYWLDQTARIRNPNITCHTRLIMDFKSTNEVMKLRAHDLFFNSLNPYLKKGIPIVIVPSHDPDKKMSNLVKLGKSLANDGRIDATSCLQRIKKISKLSEGGDRSIEVHLKSIKVVDDKLIAKRHILLLDDVTTTGNSFYACKQLLLNAGASDVTCIALGKTKR
jgi:predicted amidophosphoribosyltransferase